MRTKAFSFSGEIQTVYVLIGGVYIIEAWGAEGGGTVQPRGAYAKSYVELKKGEKLFVLVGEGAGPGDASQGFEGCGGGGGGTFIAKGSQLSTSSPLCVAGGGGSQTHISTLSHYAHGQATQTGGDLINRVQTPGQGGLSYLGPGGGGFYGNGTKGTSPNSIPGISFRDGGMRIPGYISESAYGGFGGGAANHGYCGNPCGGGGYSGGSSHGNTYNHNGGGGGSYHESFSPFFISYAKAGDELMPSHRSSIASIENITGNAGNGFARITLFYTKEQLTCKYYRPLGIAILPTIIILFSA